MTDRELLEMAAKAAGIGRFQTTSPFRSDIPYFDPLTDDGDALRLAVKLDMQVEYLEFTGNARARSRIIDTEWQTEYCMSTDLTEKDPYAAARRAIVRAAADIGRKIR